MYLLQFKKVVHCIKHLHKFRQKTQVLHFSKSLQIKSGRTRLPKAARLGSSSWCSFGLGFSSSIKRFKEFAARSLILEREIVRLSARNASSYFVFKVHTILLPQDTTGFSTFHRCLLHHFQTSYELPHISLKKISPPNSNTFAMQEERILMTSTETIKCPSPNLTMTTKSS